jgi:hypothetical protein
VGITIRNWKLAIAIWHWYWSVEFAIFWSGCCNKILCKYNWMIAIMKENELKKLQEFLEQLADSNSNSDSDSDSVEISGEALNAKAKLKAPAKHIGSLGIVAAAVSLVLIALSLYTQAEETKLAHDQIRKQVFDMAKAIRFQTCIYSLPVEHRREEFKNPYECNLVRF